MTNLEWLKQTWIEQIKTLMVDELYEFITSGRICGGICKYCEEIFPPCEDTLKDDNICRERFKLLCNMEHQKIEEDTHV